MHLVCPWLLSSLTPRLITFSLFLSSNPIASPGCHQEATAPLDPWLFNSSTSSHLVIFTPDFPKLTKTSSLFSSFSFSEVSPFPSLPRKSSMLPLIISDLQPPLNCSTILLFHLLFQNSLGHSFTWAAGHGWRNPLFHRLDHPKFMLSNLEWDFSAACNPTTFPWPSGPSFLNLQNGYFKNSFFPNLYACPLYHPL